MLYIFNVDNCENNRNQYRKSDFKFNPFRFWLYDSDRNLINLLVNCSVIQSICSALVDHKNLWIENIIKNVK